MQAYTLTLNDTIATLDLVGGKGASLARLSQAGLPVPGGFHITTNAYKKFVADNGLGGKIREALDEVDPGATASIERASVCIGDSFRDVSIPDDIREAILACYEALRIANPSHTDVRVAVRSSATAEDLPDASFAGQQETYLNIHGEGELLEAVKKCWASLWTARAIAYRVKNNIDQQTVALAVVVQEMAFAESAGVMFTANPVNGKRNEMVINAAWGLGEAIVSGLVSPDTVIIDRKKSRVIRQEIAEKQVMTVRTENGTSEQPVPEKMKTKAALSRQQALDLSALGERIEAYYGVPMDIEWAYANGVFQILQARPITTLGPEWNVPVENAIYARGSLAEHIPSPVTPLFATLGLKLANQATFQMWNRVMGPATARSLLVGEGMYTAINGFVYGGMRMGWKDIILVTRMSIAQIGPMFHGSVERWQEARKRYQQVVQTWEQKEIKLLSSNEILGGIKEVFGAACVYFTDIQMCLPAASSSEVMLTRFYNSLVKRKGDPEVTTFLLGFDTRALAAEKSLYDLAEWIKQEPGLLNWFLQTDSGAISWDPKPEDLPNSVWLEWRRRFESHLAEFGKTAFEFDFANPTPIESPTALVETIKAFLSNRAGSPYERQNAAINRREEATQHILARLVWPAKGWFIQLLRWAQKTSPMREDSISDMGMGHPILRKMFAELGRRLVHAGVLELPEDIYWMEEKELLACVEAGSADQTLPDMQAKIKNRKAAWQKYLKLSPPVMLPENSGWSRLIQNRAAQVVDGKTVMKGIGTSSGTVTARACILNGPEDFGKMKPGDVLVAVTTTPAWTPLFILASAVVTDIGGPLSHSSIVAREYSIPAVMAVRGATRLIPDGEVITVDGGNGTVTF